MCVCVCESVRGARLNESECGMCRGANLEAKSIPNPNPSPDASNTANIYAEARNVGGGGDGDGIKMQMAPLSLNAAGTRQDARTCRC